MAEYLSTHHASPSAAPLREPQKNRGIDGRRLVKATPKRHYFLRSQTVLERFKDDVTEHCLEYLEVREVARLGLTSAFFHTQVLENDDLWRRMYIRLYGAAALRVAHFDGLHSWKDRHLRLWRIGGGCELQPEVVYPEGSGGGRRGRGAAVPIWHFQLAGPRRTLCARADGTVLEVDWGPAAGASGGDGGQPRCSTALRAPGHPPGELLHVVARGRVIVAACSDRRLYLWRDRRLVQTLVGHEHEVSCLCFVPHPHHAGARGSDKFPSDLFAMEGEASELPETWSEHQDEEKEPPWTTAAGGLLPPPPQGPQPSTAAGPQVPPPCAAQPPPGECCDGAPPPRPSGGGGGGGCHAIVSGSCDKTIRVWPCGSGRSYVLGRHTMAVLCLWAWRGRLLFSGGSDYRVCVWSLRGRRRLRLLRPFRSAVTCLAGGVARGAELLVAGSADSSVRVFRILAAKNQYPLVKSFRESSSVPAVDAVWLEGHLVLAAYSDQVLKVWSLASGACLRRLASGHTDTIAGVAVGPEAFYTAAHDGTLRRWRFAGGGCAPPGAGAGGAKDLGSSLEGGGDRGAAAAAAAAAGGEGEEEGGVPAAGAAAETGVGHEVMLGEGGGGSQPPAA